MTDIFWIMYSAEIVKENTLTRGHYFLWKPIALEQVSASMFLSNNSIINIVVFVTLICFGVLLSLNEGAASNQRAV